MAKRPDRGTLLCATCGGGVPLDRVVCPYCKTPVPVPAAAARTSARDRRTYCTRCATLYPTDAGRCPRCPPAAGDLRGGTCPRCADALEPTALGPLTVDRCRGCHGLWFDGDEIERGMDATTGRMSADQASRVRSRLPAAGRAGEPVRYLACVRCGERMVRRQAARRAGVVVDVCAPHGVWFDAGEFEHFRAWAAAGGLEAFRQEDDALAAGRRREAAARRVADEGPDLGVTPVDLELGGSVLDVLLRGVFGRWF